MVKACEGNMLFIPTSRYTKLTLCINNKILKYVAPFLSARQWVLRIKILWLTSSRFNCLYLFAIVDYSSKRQKSLKSSRVWYPIPCRHLEILWFFIVLPLLSKKLQIKIGMFVMTIHGVCSFFFSKVSIL